MKISCIKWKRSEEIWEIRYPLLLKLKQKGFLRCPKCGKRNLRYKQDYDTIKNKIIINRIICMNAKCSLVFQVSDLKKISQNFLNNRYCSDLLSKVCERYTMSKRLKRGYKEGDIEFEIVKGKLIILNEETKLICGHCLKTSSFKVKQDEAETLFQCKRCGRLNTSKFIKLGSNSDIN